MLRTIDLNWGYKSGSTVLRNEKTLFLSLYLFECFFETLNYSRFTQQWAMIFTRQVH
jgi:hypothetical protein